MTAREDAPDAGGARLSRRQQRILRELESGLAGDLRLRRWCEQFELDKPAQGSAGPGARRGRSGVLAPALFAGLLVTGTVLTVLSTTVHSGALAVVGLILFLLAPIGTGVLDQHAHRRDTRLRRAGRPARSRPSPPANGWTANGWAAGLQGGMWLLP